MLCAPNHLTTHGRSGTDFDILELMRNHLKIMIEKEKFVHRQGGAKINFTRREREDQKAPGQSYNYMYSFLISALRLSMLS